MVDPDGWLSSPAVGAALEQCRTQLWTRYRDLDEDAKKLQGAHLRSARLVAVLAFAAILAALLESLFSTFLLTVFEFLAGVAALVAAIQGIRTARHHEWLVNRHKAERLRYAKFHFLTSPDLWHSDRKHLAYAELDDMVGRIERLDIGLVRAWIGKDHAPTRPKTTSTADLNADAIRELRDYYHDIRFTAQLNYLSQKGREPSPTQKVIQRLPQALFFATAMIIFLHFALEFAHHFIPGYADGPQPQGALLPVLVLCAVLLPALGAMVRTVTLASEVGRNSRRSSAKHEALDEMAGPLRSHEDPQAILRALWACEYVIESDHREWLRLMIDAEWFG